MSEPAAPHGRLIAGGLLLLAVVIAVWTLPLAEWLDAASGWIGANPWLGRAVFVGGFALGSVMMVPGSVLTMSGGYLFGLLGGVPLVSLGVVLGAAGAYLVARYLARDWVAAQVAGNERLAALDHALAERSFLVVVLTRLSLLIPFNLLNYAYGISRVRPLPYIFATWLGMIPAVTLYVYLGSVAKNVDQLVSGETDTGLAGEVLFFVGLAAIVVATIVIHRTATRALKDRLATAEGGG